MTQSPRPPKLTPRRQAVLQFIAQQIQANRYAPSQREIADHFGIFPSAVQGHLAALEARGCIVREPLEPRGIRVV